MAAPEERVVDEPPTEAGLQSGQASPPPASYRDSGQQALGHVGYNDADEEDDSLQPGVLKDQRKDEERHAQEHSHTRDDVDKMFNFRSDGSLAPFQPRSQSRNPAHHGSIPGVHNNATCSALKKKTEYGKLYPILSVKLQNLHNYTAGLIKEKKHP